LLIAVAIVLVAGMALFAYGHFVGLRRLCVRRRCLAGPSPLRLVQISDIHYCGDRELLESVVLEVNNLGPDLVCITGDLAGTAELLPEALEVLRRLRAPVFAVPGNWDYRTGADLEALRAFCEATGGCFLVNESARFAEDLTVVGLDDMKLGAPDVEKAFSGVAGGGNRALVLMHCPATVEMLGERRVALALAGHSHGGQVRLPLIGALLLPRHTRPYVMGMFETPNGPLYVNAGIGASSLPLRLFCPPEITLFEFREAGCLPDSNGRPAETGRPSCSPAD